MPLDKGKAFEHRKEIPQGPLTGRQSGEWLRAMAHESARIQRLNDAEKMIGVQIDPTKLSADLLHPIRRFYEKGRSAGFDNEKVRAACEKIIVFRGLLSDTTRADFRKQHGEIKEVDAKDSVATLLEELKKSGSADVIAQRDKIIKSLQGELTQDTVAGPSKQNDCEEGSWAAITSQERWNQTRAFWDGGQQKWSSERATEKVINQNNIHEFQEMQDLKIPGYYLQHKNKDGNIDQYAYIPISIQGAWKKALSDLNERQLKHIGGHIKNRTKYGWSIAKTIARPDVDIKSPGGTPHTIEHREGAIGEYYKNEFQHRAGESSIAKSSFSSLFAQNKEVKKYKRISVLPEGLVKERVQTPITWKVVGTSAPDQGSSSRTGENEGN